MIVTTTRHGRTRRDTRFLLAHLARQDGQKSSVVDVAAPVRTAGEALAYMEALRDGSRASVAYHHISLSPSAPLTDEQRREAVRRVLEAMGAADHAHVVWEHAEKRRRGSDVDAHYHVVLSHVGPDGKALNDGRSYVRLEAVARTLEADFGHKITPGRRSAAVTTELERQSRPDVALRVQSVTPPEPPTSAMSSQQRMRAERRGCSLPDVRDAVRQAWKASDGAVAFRTALAEHGLAVLPGDKEGVWLVTGQNGVTLGALDRLARERRRTVAIRMKEETHDLGTATHDAGFESDLRRGKGRTCGSGSPESAAVAPRFHYARSGLVVGRGDRTACNDSASTARDPHGDRGDGHPARRTDAALAIAALAKAASDQAARREVRRLQRQYHPRGRELLDTRRLARIDLDEIRRMAERLAGRWSAFLMRPGQPYRPDPHAALRKRLRDVAECPDQSYQVGRLDEEELTPNYRP